MMSVRPLLNFPLVTKAEDEWDDTWQDADDEGSADTPFPGFEGVEGKEEEGDGCSESSGGSDVSEVGFRPTFEKPGDAIPRQSVFLARAQRLIQAASSLEEDLVARGRAIMEFLTFLLRFEHAPFHRAYPQWRRVANEKCASFLEEAEEPELRSLCRTFMTKFPK